MRFRIRTGGFGFTNYAEIQEADVTVARCSGLGRIHYLFAASHQVYWVEADPEGADAAWTYVRYALRETP
jgi:hypothetical protein